MVRLHVADETVDKNGFHMIHEKGAHDYGGGFPWVYHSWAQKYLNNTC